MVALLKQPADKADQFCTDCAVSIQRIIVDQWRQPQTRIK